MLVPVVEPSILRIVKHNVLQERILFRHEVDLDKPEEIIHLSSPVPSPAPSICSGIASVVTAPPGFTNANNTKSSFAEKVACGISNGFPQDFSRQKILHLPAWLNKSFGHRVHGTLNYMIPTIEEECKSKIFFGGKDSDPSQNLRLKICTPEENHDLFFKKAVEKIENVLVELIGADQSRGRLLYDMALSYDTSKRPDGVVLQRSPLNSRERVWMCVIEFPFEFIQGEKKKLVLPSIDGRLHDEMHHAKCNLVLCKDNFGFELSCEPYALVLGKQAKGVSAAIGCVKSAIERYNRPSLASLCVPSSLGTSELQSPSFCWEFHRTPKKSVFPSSRRLSIPSWLLSDPSFRGRVQSGLFGQEWGEERLVGQSTNCKIALVGNDVEIKSNGLGSPNLSKATSIVEDELLNFLGGEESKCRLLHELTASYSNEIPGGIIQIRNPLNSNEQVWASIVEIPFILAEDGIRRWLMAPFSSKEMDDELHKLKCVAKVCTDNFSFELRRCDPYVVVMGRQKSSVSRAIGFVVKAIKRYQKKISTHS